MGLVIEGFRVIAKVLAFLSPLIFVRLVVPLPDYLAGMIDLVLVAAPALALIASLAFTFQSIFRR